MSSIAWKCTAPAVHSRKKFFLRAPDQGRYMYGDNLHVLGLLRRDVDGELDGHAPGERAMCETHRDQLLRRAMPTAKDPAATGPKNTVW